MRIYISVSVCVTVGLWKYLWFQTRIGGYILVFPLSLLRLLFTTPISLPKSIHEVTSELHIYITVKKQSHSLEDFLPFCIPFTSWLALIVLIFRWYVKYFHGSRSHQEIQKDVWESPSPLNPVARFPFLLLSTPLPAALYNQQSF